MDGQLLAAALIHGFRARRPDETEARYRAALIDHVATRDYAAAFELIVRRAQTAWTPDDARAFQDYLQSRTGPPEDLSPGVHAFPLQMTAPGASPVTEAALLRIAETTLDGFMQTRRDRPTAALPVLVLALLTDGRVISTSVRSCDRLAILKTLAQTHPLFGFVLAFDAWMHKVVNGCASKQDALLLHVGTRDLRQMRCRPYRLEGGRVTFVEPPPPDLDKRDAAHVDDPYASVFVTATAPGKAQ
jgi:hypothetical protein